MSRKTLRFNDRGNEVKELQSILNSLGYNSGKADGIFGSRTRNAVMAFQRANKLTVDGIVGKNTWRALDNVVKQPLLKKGSRGQAVVVLQNKLNQLGYNCGRADGIFGANTEKAVRKLQKDRGLSVDGIVGKNTWRALDSYQTNSSTTAQKPTIKKNSRGSTVAYLQSKLNSLGYHCGAVDGIFGQGTHNAVKQFQQDNKLSVDGIVGKNTWIKLSTAKPRKRTKEPVYYSQKDVRWRYVMYSNHGNRSQTIGSSGCGTVCMAMILATWKSPSITPIQTSDLAVKHGFRSRNNGTYWSYFPWMAKRYGLKHQQTSSTDEAVKAIKKGALVVASMGKGYFTKGGHYILLWDVQGDKIICHDPAKKTRNKASITLFKRESKQYFIFEK